MDSVEVAQIKARALRQAAEIFDSFDEVTIGETDVGSNMIPVEPAERLRDMADAIDAGDGFASDAGTFDIARVPDASLWAELVRRTQERESAGVASVWPKVTLEVAMHDMVEPATAAEATVARLDSYSQAEHRQGVDAARERRRQDANRANAAAKHLAHVASCPRETHGTACLP